MTAGTLITILATGWSIALLLAAWWAWGSVRSWWFSRGGKRAGTRYCRACSFDLTGLTRDDTTPAKRCPECGAEIDRAGAVVIGKAITRRPKLKWAALAVALVTALVFATLTVVRPPVLWLQWMPDGVLVRVAAEDVEPNSQIALIQLGARWGFPTWTQQPAFYSGMPVYPLLVNGVRKPSRDNLIKLAKCGLERQADRSRSWERVWGEVIESAIAEGVLDEEQRSKYVENWMTVDVTTRPKIRKGSKLPIRLAMSDVRTPHVLNVFAASPGLVPRLTSSSVRTASTNYRVFGKSSMLMEADGTESLPVGTHQIEIEVDVAVGLNEVGIRNALPRRWSKTVDVVEPDQPISLLVSDPKTNSAMAIAVAEARIDLSPIPTSIQVHSDAATPLSERVRARLWCRVAGNLPMDFAARVEMVDPRRPADQRISLGKIFIPESGTHWFGISVSADDETLSLLLATPSAEVWLVGDSWYADSQPSWGPFWGGTIEFSQVPVSLLNLPGVQDRPWPSPPR